ncbi:hypothetical protein NT239_05050 [Chitinibacter sp. SCUT-21]|uniref:hypothetical protein n=1 Tax=Chitinibacter sp. SCUT-21 TaxID=2970891 RepID=UPI0035A580BA
MRLKLFCIKYRVLIIATTLVGLLLSASAGSTQPVPEEQKLEIKKKPQFECIEINDKTERSSVIVHRIRWLPTIRNKAGSNIRFAVNFQLNKHCEITDITMIQSTGNNELDESIMKDLREVRLPIQDSNKETENVKIRFSEGP